MINTKPPWLTQPDEIYAGNGAWEAYGDFDCWIISQLDDEAEEYYHSVHPILKTALYGVFCELFNCEESL